jgi:hypothetical protein
MAWFHDHKNLADLWRWLEVRGDAPDDPAYFMEKPWKWTPEFEGMTRSAEWLARMEARS